MRAERDFAMHSNGMKTSGMAHLDACHPTSLPRLSVVPGRDNRVPRVARLALLLAYGSLAIVLALTDGAVGLFVAVLAAPVAGAIWAADAELSRLIDDLRFWALVTYASFLGLGALAHFRTHLTDELTPAVVTVSLLGMLGLQSGAYALPALTPRVWPRFGLAPLPHVLISVLTVGLLSGAWLADMVGGLTALLWAPYIQWWVLDSSWGLVALTGTKLLIIAGALSWVLRRHSSGAFASVLCSISLSAAVAFCIVYKSRGNIVYLILAGLVAYRDRVRGIAKRLKRLVALAMGLSLVFAFTLYRERPSDIIDSETDQSRAASEVMKGGDTFATLLSVTQAVPECFPYEWGGTLVAPLVAPVPRAWWAGKPSAYGNVLARRFWGNDVKTSVAPSLPGEFYANFGLWGVFPSMLVVGWVLCSLQGWYRCWEHLPAAKAIQVMFLPNVVGLIRGDFFNAIAPVIFIYLPLSVLFVSRRPRK